MTNRIFIEPTLNNAKEAAKFIFEKLKPSQKNFIFSKTKIITSTRSAANAIAKDLANLAMQSFGGGLAGLEIITLDALLKKFTLDKPSANECERYFSLTCTIKKFQADELPNLFPEGIPPAPKNFFRKFLEIKTLCAQASLSISEAAKKILESANIEADRWCEIEKFDKAYTLTLQNISKLDPADALLCALKNPTQIPEEIFLVGVCDAPKIFFDILKKYEASDSQINSIIIANKKFSKHFDDYGKPDTNFWQDTVFEILNSDILVPQNRTIQAQFVANDAANILDAQTNLAIACEEGESSSAITQTLAQINLKTFSPEGEKLSDGEIFDFLKSLKLYFSSFDFDSLKALVQKEALLLRLKTETDLPAKKIFEIIDTFAFEKFSTDIESAKILANSTKDKNASILFDAISQILNPQVSSNADKIIHILQCVFGITRTLDANIKDEAQSLADTLSQIKSAEKNFGEISLVETIEVLIKAADKRVFNEVRLPNEIQMKNWLEIFWTAEPNLFIADFNDGQVPENISSDAYIPNSLREQLGIRGAKERHARDSYFLHTILSSRKNSAVKFYTPQTDFDGEPLRPSRLLLQCKKSEIVERAKHLFQDGESEKSSRAFAHSWQMLVPKVELPEYLSATDFKAYLNCPFEFYLTRILKLNSIDTKKRELDAIDIGTITHAALEYLVNTNKKTHNEDEIYEILKSYIDKFFKKEFGTNLTTAIELQKCFILSKFKAVANFEAAHRSVGWKTIEVEKKLCQLNAAGFKINAKIDRIDYNEQLDVFLLIDYKTSDKNPNKTHYSSKSKKWKDLQLPIYILSAKKYLQTDKVEAAYFTISKTSDNTKLVWYKNNMQESASTKIEEIAQNIRNLKFEPSTKSPLEKKFPEYFGFASNNLKKFLDFNSIK